MGRFLNHDVVFDTDAGLQGYNLYAYCGNNPILRIDSSGADSEKNEDLDIADAEMSLFGGGGLSVVSTPTPNPEVTRVNIIKELLNTLNLIGRTFKDGMGGLANDFRSQPMLRRTADQQALADLANGVVRDANRGVFISYEEAMLLDEWALEYNVPQHHPAQNGSGEHWLTGWDHTHIYNIHVPYK